MTQDSEKLTARESLDLIASMIAEAKGNVQKNNFFFLLWGWVVVIANVGMYMLFMLGYKHPYIVWLITIPAWIYTFYKAATGEKRQRAVSHFDRISGALWISYGVTIFLIVAFGARTGWMINPLILLVTAIPTLVSGIVLRFRPLVYGGIAFWIGGAITFLVPLDQQPLAGGLTIIAGYLVPGYMLKNRER